MKTYKRKDSNVEAHQEGCGYKLFVNETCIGHANSSRIEKNDNWQEITKDYEILRVKCLATGVLENYRGAEAYDINYWDINAVKRLSDGEMFSVGEDVEDGGKILKLKESNKGIIAECEHRFIWLRHLRKARQPVLTSEDGVELFQGDKHCTVNKETLTINEGITEKNEDCTVGWLYFSTREAAEEYRLNYARMLSIADIKEAIKESGGMVDFDPVFLISFLGNLTKSRL